MAHHWLIERPARWLLVTENISHTLFSHEWERSRERTGGTYHALEST